MKQTFGILTLTAHARVSAIRLSVMGLYCVRNARVQGCFEKSCTVSEGFVLD